MADWSNFANIDLAAINSEVQELENGRGNAFEELPDGKYEVSLDSLELKASKAGDPMVAATFRVLAGDYTNRLIFMNQLLLHGNQNNSFRVHTCNVFLRALDTRYTPNVNFSQGVAAYERLVSAVASEAVNNEYLLELRTNKNGFRSYTVLEHFDTTNNTQSMYVAGNVGNTKVLVDASGHIMNPDAVHMAQIQQALSRPQMPQQQPQVVQAPAPVPMQAIMPPDALIPTPASVPMQQPQPQMPQQYFKPLYNPQQPQQQQTPKLDSYAAPAGVQNDSDIPF